MIDDLKEVKSLKISNTKNKDIINLETKENTNKRTDELKKEVNESDFFIEKEKIFDVESKLETKVYKETKGVHTAILCLEDEKYVISDVGRHNTFDKIIGKALLEKADFHESILLSTARQSRSMVKKAGRANIPIIATIAAPLTSGIEEAKENDQTLIGLIEKNNFTIFTGKEKIKF